MTLTIDYRTPDLFTLGELRAMLSQQAGLPDECVVKLVGMDRSDFVGAFDDDMIRIEWDAA